MIIILSGPPGSGKTTIAQRLVQELGDARMISSDLFKGKVYERISREVESRRGGERYLILDATFYRKAYRDGIREIASKGESVLTVFIDCPLEVCVERNRLRQSPIPENAVHIICRQFERPDDADIVINSGETGVEEATREILKRIKK